MQDTWLSKKADEIQQYADQHDMKRFYYAVHQVPLHCWLLAYQSMGRALQDCAEQAIPHK